MLSKDPEKRLSCSELLDKSHEWTVDTNIIKNEKYGNFLEMAETNEELKTLKTFVEFNAVGSCDYFEDFLD